MSINNCEYLVVFMVFPDKRFVPSVMFEKVTPVGKSVNEFPESIARAFVTLAKVIVLGKLGSWQPPNI